MDVVLRVVVLTAIYLLVLTSVHPGDVLTGLVLSVLLVVAGRRIRPLGPPVDEPLPRRLAGVPGLIFGTLVDLAVSTWRTALWCLSPRRRPWPRERMHQLPWSRVRRTLITHRSPARCRKW